MTENKLKPCPFCGGKAYFDRMGTCRQSCIVECGSCGVRHESSDEYGRSGMSWNERHADRAAPSASAQQLPGLAFADWYETLSPQWRKVVEAACESEIEGAHFAAPSASAQQAEPVAWHIGNADGSINKMGAVYNRRSLAEKHIESYEGELDACIVPLYAAPAPSASPEPVVLYGGGETPISFEDGASPAAITREQIRTVFLANGFTVKPGHDDLKEYVYEAASALIGLAWGCTGEVTVVYEDDKPSASPAPADDDQKDLYNLCAALVDICDDATNNPPESRAYVDGAYATTVAELREALARDGASPAALTDERAAFEAWAKERTYNLGQLGGVYAVMRTTCAWDGWLGRAGLAASPADQGKTQAATDAAMHAVLAERIRQITHEGWSPAHDDNHGCGDLAEAASCYASEAAASHAGLPNGWPWAKEWWKPSTPRRNLVKAGALILAEIERIDRAAMSASKESPDA